MSRSPGQFMKEPRPWFRGARRADSDENRALLPDLPGSTDIPQVPLTAAPWPHSPWTSTLKSWSSSPATLVATHRYRPESETCVGWIWSSRPSPRMRTRRLGVTGWRWKEGVRRSGLRGRKHPDECTYIFTRFLKHHIKWSEHPDNSVTPDPQHIKIRREFSE